MVRLAIDVDGVIADFKSDFMTSKYNSDPKTKNAFWQNPPYNFWINLTPLIDAKFFRDIVKDREIIFLTNCPNTIARRDWLKKHKFWTDNSCLWCNAPGESKRSALKMLNVDLFVDDYGNNCLECTGVTNIFKFNANNPVQSWTEIDYLLNGEKK